MTQKIIIIDHEPLTIRRRQIFYIEELRAAGFEVEFWDCSQYFHPGMVLADTLNEKYLTHYDSFNQIVKQLERTDIENSVFIVETFDNWKNRNFFRLLSDRKCLTVKMELYSTATLGDISFWRKLMSSNLSKLSKAFICRLKSIALKIHKKIYNVTGFKVLISSGNSPQIDVHINHPDWESFANCQPFLNANPYSVFLDEYFPLHPDMTFFVNHTIKADHIKYQKTMGNFFDNYKKESSVEVIVAAHPKSQYTGSEFNNCQTIKYSTSSLIKGCCCVFAHASSSIAYAIMADKPIAIIATDDYLRTPGIAIGITKVSQQLGLPIYNLDKCDTKTIVAQKLTPSARQNYIYSYLTSPGIEQKKNIEILLDFFRGGTIG